MEGPRAEGSLGTSRGGVGPARASMPRCEDLTGPTSPGDSAGAPSSRKTPRPASLSPRPCEALSARPRPAAPRRRAAAPRAGALTGCGCRGRGSGFHAVETSTLAATAQRSHVGPAPPGRQTRNHARTSVCLVHGWN